MSKLNYVIWIFFVTYLYSCNINTCYNRFPKETITPTVTTDKQNIAQSYIENIEYFRKYKYFGEQKDLDKESIHPYSQYDPSNFFVGYAYREDLKTNKDINSPKQTDSQLTVHVDQIVYDKDSLRCVAFVWIDQHFDEITNLKPKTEPGLQFDGRVVFGARDSISERFKIYPFQAYKVSMCYRGESSLQLLKELFFCDIKGQKGPHNYKYFNEYPYKEADVYPHSLSEPEFFDTAPDFKKCNKENLTDYYIYELYTPHGNWSKILPYQYYSNQPDSIKALWDKGIENWIDPEL